MPPGPWRSPRRTPLRRSEQRASAADEVRVGLPHTLHQRYSRTSFSGAARMTGVQNDRVAGVIGHPCAKEHTRHQSTVDQVPTINLHRGKIPGNAQEAITASGRAAAVQHHPRAGFQGRCRPDAEGSEVLEVGGQELPETLNDLFGLLAGLPGRHAAGHGAHRSTRTASSNHTQKSRISSVPRPAANAAALTEPSEVPTA